MKEDKKMTAEQAIEEIKEEQCDFQYKCKACLKEKCCYYIAIEAIRFREELRKKARESKD